MLKQTFCHLPGVSSRLERELWTMGVHSWEDLAEAEEAQLTWARRQMLQQHLAESKSRLDCGDAGFFASSLPSKEVWRIFPDFRGSLAYFDIETTGLSGTSDHITTIALYDGRRVRHYVYGQNLQEFVRDIREYHVIVTYNGKCFDVPFIRSFLGVDLDQAHIDLRYVLRSLGYSGGLKGCERQLGISRGDLEDVDGFFAVVLWNDYQRHQNAKTLETLLAYNIQDVLNLEALLVMAYNAKLRDTPF